jgi:hypothetical protein
MLWKESLDNVQEFGNSPEDFEWKILRIMYGQIRKLCSLESAIITKYNV